MGIFDLIKYCGDNGISAVRNEPLKNHCTFKIGGPAAIFIEGRDIHSVKKIIKTAKNMDARLFVLGNGSNVLFSDNGFDGAVLHIGKGLESMRMAGENLIEASSGASLKALCVFAAERGLSGLEFAYGIPGSVGGAIYMNAGAYGGEIRNALVKAYHLTENGVEGSFSGDRLDFGYRRSVYSNVGFIITGGVFKLNKGDKDEIAARMGDYLSRRRDKQPLDMPSAGSTFKRPASGYASALIDDCGLKGEKVGGAMVSEKHAGFIVNTGGATCNDVLGLIDRIKTEVLRQKGIGLSCEIKVVE